MWLGLPTVAGGHEVHDRGGPYGHTEGAKRIVAVDVTGLPLALDRAPRSAPAAAA